ncbi:MAG: cfp6 [Frankiales bacterium]|jgi:hypothetical protein|nr:cfp6 [Frankiales bacterium]
MADSERVRFGPERIAIAPVLVMAIGAIPLGLSSPWLRWVLLVPVACAVWVLRARVVVARDGLEVCHGLTTRRYPWNTVEGFDVPRRGPVRLLTGGRQVALTPLPRRQVRELVAACTSASGVAAG